MRIALHTRSGDPVVQIDISQQFPSQADVSDEHTNLPLFVSWKGKVFQRGRWEIPADDNAHPYWECVVLDVTNAPQLRASEEVF